MTQRFSLERKPGTARSRFGLALCAVIGVVLFSAAPASAYGHRSGAAIDNSTSSAHDPWADTLYIATGTEKVVRINWAGQYQGYFTTPNYTTQMGEATAIAVDSSNTASTGDLYVADREAGAVYMFEPTWREQNEVIREFAGLSEPHSLAVDSVGNIYVSQLGAGNVLEFFLRDNQLITVSPSWKGWLTPEI
jgi:sugar lactone lactonase YvrE